jgi:hypothetical protein
VLLRAADALDEADTILAPRLPRSVIEAVVADVPREWIADPAAYIDYFTARLATPRAFVAEAQRARD